MAVRAKNKKKSLNVSLCSSAGQVEPYFFTNLEDIFSCFNTPDRLQSKTLILWTDVDQKKLETEFLIAKWQSKTLFLVILIHICQLLRVFSIATYPVCSRSKLSQE